jgi:hypothetical protein
MDRLFRLSGPSGAAGSGGGRRREMERVSDLASRVIVCGTVCVKGSIKVKKAFVAWRTFYPVTSVPKSLCGEGRFGGGPV